MVLSWNIKQVVKKKISATAQDKKDWFNFTQKKEKVYNKESELADNDIIKSKIEPETIIGNDILNIFLYE